MMRMRIGIIIIIITIIIIINTSIIVVNIAIATKRNLKFNLRLSGNFPQNLRSLATKQLKLWNCTAIQFFQKNEQRTKKNASYNATHHRADLRAKYNEMRCNALKSIKLTTKKKIWNFTTLQWTQMQGTTNQAEEATK